MESRPSPEHRVLRRAAILTTAVGIGFTLASLAGYVLLVDAQRTVEAALERSESLESLELTGGEIAALYLLPFSAIFFLWFIVALRSWIRASQVRRNELVGDVQLVSGAVFTAVFLVGSGSIATVVILLTSGDDIDAALLDLLRHFGNTLMLVFGVRIASVFVLATGTLGLTTMALPRWFAYLSFAFGIVLMLTPVADDRLFLAFPVWVGVLGLMLGYHLTRLPVDQMPGFAGPAEPGDRQAPVAQADQAEQPGPGR